MQFLGRKINYSSLKFCFLKSWKINIYEYLKTFEIDSRLEELNSINPNISLIYTLKIKVFVKIQIFFLSIILSSVSFRILIFGLCKSLEIREFTFLSNFLVKLYVYYLMLSLSLSLFLSLSLSLSFSLSFFHSFSFSISISLYYG